MSVVVLFDVDGTLIDTAGAGRRAMERAFVEVTGSADSLESFRFAGMTDRAIVRQGLIGLDHDSAEVTIDAVLAAYLASLPVELAAERRYLVHPGVRELCGRLEEETSLAVGLGTGNLEAGARAKLEVGGLNRWFRFGGFGCDHEDRAELLRAGAVRGAAQLGLSSLDGSNQGAQVVVVGDTPKDVAAAAEIGASCVAVRTGGYLEPALHGAELIVDDLTDPRVAAALGV